MPWDFLKSVHLLYLSPQWHSVCLSSYGPIAGDVLSHVRWHCMNHRFRTAETSGTVRLLEGCVEMTFSRNLSRWTYQVPYAKLDPHPVRLWATASTIWVCLGVGALGVFGAISEIVGAEGRFMPFWMPPFVLIGALGLLWFAFIHRREEWVIFSSPNDAHVRYCRNGPDAATYTRFTDALIAKIERHQKQGSGAPDDDGSAA